MLVAPPGNLKSTVIRHSLESFGDVKHLSDINVKTLDMLKAALIDQRYTTLAIGEYEKLYQRNPATASNIEGHVKQLIEEGFGLHSFADQEIITKPAYCLVVAGLTPSCEAKKFTGWKESGFYRRFLWCHYSLRSRNIIGDAIEAWKPINLGRLDCRRPINGQIPFKVDKKESHFIREIINKKQSEETPQILLKKTFAVMKWRHNSSRKAMEILEDFCQSLYEVAEVDL